MKTRQPTLTNHWTNRNQIINRAKRVGGIGALCNTSKNAKNRSIVPTSPTHDGTIGTIGTDQRKHPANGWHDCGTIGGTIDGRRLHWLTGKRRSL